MHDHQAMLFYQQQMKCACPRPGLHAPALVADYIEAGLKAARYYEKQQCALLQELYLRRTFHEILNKMCDSLIHCAIRKQCLEQLYKPLMALKRFYKTHNSTRKYLILEREARILSHEFNPF
ncbi:MULTISPECIES: hypothetical protein [Pseudoalteromonas]|uniref:hypothetical protein n=1 Tax=Pseudoalteromonas TaxID=53246 RepID=UPI00037ED0A5|nr:MULTISPECIES: hypothetical protein [Pseudoalteromonas]MCF6145703.1 hypothetical protein [Pseudoalteromonas mariniglutinosa NCIMB 1770]